MDDVLDRLRGVADAPPTAPERLDGLRRRAARLRRRRRSAAGAAVVVVAVVAGGGVTTVVRDREPAPVAVEVGGPTTTVAPTTSSPPPTGGVAPPSTLAITAPSRSAAWTVPNPAGRSARSVSTRPVAAGDVVVVAGGFEDGRVLAYRTTTGEEVWAYRVGEGAFVLGAGDGLALVAPQFGRVVALDLATGVERWRFDLPPRAAPEHATITGGRVWLGASFTAEASVEAPIVTALETATGRPVWQAVLDEGTDLLWAPPVLGDGLAVVAAVPSHPGSAPTSYLYALDAATGARRWRADLHSERSAFHDLRPVISGGSVYAVGGQGDLLAFDAATGRERWSRRAEMALPVIAGVAHDQVVGKMGDEVVGLDAATGNEQWKVAATRTPRSGMSWATIVGEVAYVVEPARTFAVSLPQGRILWDLAVETVQPPVFDATTVYLAGPQRLLAVELVTGEPQWTAPVPGQPFSATSLAPGRYVVVATADGSVAAVAG